MVGLGDMQHAQAFRDDTGTNFPLLVDDRREAYRAVGLKRANLMHLLRPNNLRARGRANAAGHRQRRIGKHPFQLGGSFVFGPGNLDLFAQVSGTFGDNCHPSELLAVLTAHVSRSPALG